MRRNQGFTLIELMVVMAIIAILATAGLSAYGGYLKKARDSTRISDIRAINSIVQASLSSNGNAPDFTTIRDAIIAMNNGILLTDPLDEQDVCLDNNKQGQTCEYLYKKCNDGGYVLRISFESESNIVRYANGQDELYSNDTDINEVNRYDLGACTDYGLGNPTAIR